MARVSQPVVSEAPTPFLAERVLQPQERYHRTREEALGTTRGWLSRSATIARAQAARTPPPRR
ncbi:MAG: hypothetical protein E6K55_13225 [Gemmatimonadetes bacterium]|nr:MAG: hypothetical protein E6K55_13225 [Gemmatimonadota bacterium]